MVHPGEEEAVQRREPVPERGAGRERALWQGESLRAACHSRRIGLTAFCSTINILR